MGKANWQGIGSYDCIGSGAQPAAPRAAHSAVAALVSVVGNVAVTNPLNSSGGPQPLIVQNVAGVAGTPVTIIAACGPFEGVCTTTSVSSKWPDQAVLITDVSGDCQITASVLYTSVYFGTSGIGFELPPQLNGSFESQLYYSFGRQMNVTIPAGAGAPTISVYAPPSNFGGCAFDINGYVVN